MPNVMTTTDRTTPMTTSILLAPDGPPLAPHAAARMLPPLTALEFERLVEDIRVNGQRAPIIIRNDLVVDGRHRLIACRALGIPCRAEVLPEYEDATLVALSANVVRRQLSDSQRAVIAARMVTTRHGVAAGPNDVTQARAAVRLGVSERYVRDAAWLIENHASEVDAVFEGRESLRAVVSRLRLGVRVAEREPRPALVDRFPEQAVPARPAVVGDTNIIVAAIEHIAAAGVDPAAWAHSLPTDRAAEIVVALENFARVALDIVDEEQDVNAGVAEDRDANRNVRVERGGRVRPGEAHVIDEIEEPLVGAATANRIIAAAERAGAARPRARAPRAPGVTRRRGTGETPL
jgi:hypothetical protein